MLMKTSTRVLISATTALAFAATVATADGATRPDRFGHTELRAGVPKHTAQFQITSDELKSGVFPPNDYADSFGCTGSGHAPSLTWSGAPAATKSYAITMF